MWIGVISDTAGVLVPNVLDVFDGVDYILHCGNIGDPRVLSDLSQLAPIAGVVGSTDNPEQYPFEKILFRKWFEVGIYVNHRVGDPMNLPRTTQRDLEEFDPQVVLFGGGEAYNNRIENRLFFSPGGAGRRKGRIPRSIGLLEIDGQSVRAEVVPLDEPASVG